MPVQLQASDIRAFIPSRDYALSQRFYVALGCDMVFADSDISLLELGGQRFYLQRFYQQEWADNTMLHISVADARSCHAQISALLADGSFPGARIAEPKLESYGALVCHVIDPSGVLLHLAEWV